MLGGSIMARLPFEEGRGGRVRCSPGVSLPAPRNRKNRCVHHLRRVRLTHRALAKLTSVPREGSSRDFNSDRGLVSRRCRLEDRRRIPFRALETNTIIGYLHVIGVAGERSTRAFATAEVAYLLLTTDVLALV